MRYFALPFQHYQKWVYTKAWAEPETIKVNKSDTLHFTYVWSYNVSIKGIVRSSGVKKSIYFSKLSSTPYLRLNAR